MERRAKVKGKADDNDRKVGELIRARRLELGMSQQGLSSLVGVTFQQIQKYERGINRVGASRIRQLADALQVSVNYFFDAIAGEMSVKSSGFGEHKQKAFIQDNKYSEETANLLKAFYSIDDKRLRNQIIEMAKSLAKK